MSKLELLSILIPGLPLAAALLTAMLGKRFLRDSSHVPSVVALVGSFACSLAMLLTVLSASRNPPGDNPIGYESVWSIWTWASIPEAMPDMARGAQPAAEDSVTDDPAALVRAGDFRVDIALRTDPLTVVMLVTVTFVSTLVAVYSIGYMHGDPGYWRFFTYVSLFVFSMTMLVSASNFVLLYVFWEAVGLCSYLLIGFWFEKPEAAAAGKKAFLVNRIGDFGFAMGIFLIWTTYGTLDFHDVTPQGEVATAGDAVAIPGVLGQSRLHDQADTAGGTGEFAGGTGEFAGGTGGFVGGTVGLAICLCLTLGACGKSAQFPLHVWLPDAMEGPTPVSALIHAATMVTAGVYLVARTAPLFLAAPAAQAVLACIGGFTALFAAVIALTQTDLKRVLAYSTVSQLGYMFLGLSTFSLAGLTAGMFHLFTHAFFKGLLFLGAGSVMHAMGGVIDIRRFGGLRRILPHTHRTFWFGALALGGIAPFAGFWSKDAVLAAVQERGVHDVMLPWFGWELPLYTTLFGLGLLTALLTALYTFRALFLTFYGPLSIPSEAGHHAHESPPAMTVPLVVLAACSLLAGILFGPGGGLAEFLSRTPSLAAVMPSGAMLEGAVGSAAHADGSHFTVAVMSTAAAVAGLGLAAFLYLGDRREVEWLARQASRPWGLKLYQLSHGKFFFDQIYQVVVVWPLRLLASALYWIDRVLVDGLVDTCGRLPGIVGSALRVLHGGLLQFYALAMMLGLLVLIGVLLFWQAP